MENASSLFSQRKPLKAVFILDLLLPESVKVAVLVSCHCLVVLAENKLSLRLLAWVQIFDLAALISLQGNPLDPVSL